VDHAQDQSLPWYNAWLASEVMRMPPQFFQFLNIDSKASKEEERWMAFREVFVRIAECIVAARSITLDDIVSQLFDVGMVTDDIGELGLQCVRYLVFSVLGWQTMLFKPAPMGCDPRQFAIEDEQDGYRGQAYVSLQQDIDASSKENLSELLMGFGVLLPSKNLCLSDDAEEQKAFQEQLDVHAKRLNANIIVTIAGVRLKWVDTLACHMEYNPAQKELYLFRFPSFCVSRLHTANKSVIHACATSSRLHCQWAADVDVDCLLREVLLSYRLLFGQSKKSRALFRSLDPFAGHSRSDCDPVLPLLCGKRSCPSYLDLPEKETYYLPGDFPVLRYRISLLQKHLSRSVSRTWTQLWRDKRDSAHWLTFWALISFGVLGVLLALLQVILQFVELLL
jgi:hypothetical protein